MKRLTCVALVVMFTMLMGVLLAACSGGGAASSPQQTEQAASSVEEQAVEESSSAIEEASSSTEEQSAMQEISTSAAVSSAVEPSASASSASASSMQVEKGESTSYYITELQKERVIASIDGSVVHTVREGNLSSQPKIVGPFEEGLAVVEWVTAENYDEKWGEFTGVTGHIGCVDETGKVVLDFSSAVPQEKYHWDDFNGGKGTSGMSDLNEAVEILYAIDNEPYFSEGYALIIVNFFAICVDMQGQVIWQKDVSLDYASQYQDGIAMIGGQFYNTAGEEIGTGREDYDYYSGAGYWKDADEAIHDYAGNEVLAKDFIPEGYSKFNKYCGNYGLLRGEVIEVSPNGTGAQIRSCGVWSLSDGKWLIEPIENAQFEITGPNVIYCTIANGNDEIVERKFYNFKGEPYTLDSEFASFTSLQTKRFWVDYCGNGLVQVRNDNGLVMAHFDDNKVDKFITNPQGATHTARDK